VWALEVRHDLKALLPLELLLIVDWEQRDRHGGGGGETTLTQGGESHMCHLLDGIINLTANDGSRPWCRGVKGYLHPDLTNIQDMGPKRTTGVEGDIPVRAKADNCIPHQPRKPRAVLAHGSKTPVLAKGEVGVVVNVHL
jgi:hypothetical protein